MIFPYVDSGKAKDSLDTLEDDMYKAVANVENNTLSDNWLVKNTESKI